MFKYLILLFLLAGPIFAQDYPVAKRLMGESRDAIALGQALYESERYDFAIFQFQKAKILSEAAQQLIPDEKPEMIAGNRIQWIIAQMWIGKSWAKLGEEIAKTRVLLGSWSL